MALGTPSNLQAISELRYLSEQPEGIYSLNTVDAEDLSYSRDKWCKTPLAGGPPGNDPPDNDLDDNNNNQPDDAPSVDTNICYK